MQFLICYLYDYPRLKPLRNFTCDLYHYREFKLFRLTVRYGRNRAYDNYSLIDLKKANKTRKYYIMAYIDK